MAIPLLIQRALAEIPTTEKPSACVNCDDLKKKDGYVTVFVELHSLTGHAAVFVGKATDEDRILYDPCGDYVKKGLNYRSGDVLSAEEFDYADYKEYHEEGDKNALLLYYVFKITEDEEKEIRERILDPKAPTTCSLKCAVQVRRVLTGIGPFKDLDGPGFVADFPSVLAKEVQTIHESKKREL
jgi:hypothetical protein